MLPTRVDYYHPVPRHVYDPLELYPESLLNRIFKVIGQEETLLDEMVALLSLFPLVLISACEVIKNALEKGVAPSFDPIAKDNNCQTHAFVFIENFPVFAVGCEQLSYKALQFLQTLPKRLTENFCEHADSSSFREIVQKSNLMEFLQDQDQIFEQVRINLVRERQNEGDNVPEMFLQECAEREAYSFALMQMHFLTLIKRVKKESAKKKTFPLGYTVINFPDSGLLKEHFHELQSIKSVDLQDIMRNNQFYLSRRSGNFLTKRCRLIDQTTFDVLKNETKENFVTLDRSMSSFYCTKAILNLSRYKEQFIVLRTKVVKKNLEEIGDSTLLFRSKEPHKDKGFKFIKPADHEKYKNKMALVISGLSKSDKNISKPDENEPTDKYEKRFAKFLLKKIILANVGQHAQFSGREWSNQNVQAKLGQREIQHYRKAAEEMGCTRENPELFLINHIYAEIVSIALDKNKKLYITDKDRLEYSFK